ncbi:MAG TPA: hypothetical protein VEV41_14770 [Terriglobales bacterium]|nr:hypothetical protein [Terriglobales bacterium]
MPTETALKIGLAKQRSSVGFIYRITHSNGAAVHNVSSRSAAMHRFLHHALLG